MRVTSGCAVTTRVVGANRACMERELPLQPWIDVVQGGGEPCWTVWTGAIKFSFWKGFYLQKVWEGS